MKEKGLNLLRETKNCPRLGITWKKEGEIQKGGPLVKSPPLIGKDSPTLK